MSAKNRADLIVKLHKAVKKDFQPITPPSNRTVIDHAIYACCLENSTAEEADESLAKLQENYFDWNEVRVTTDRELATTVKSLTDPLKAATRVKKMLYGIFETYYQFDLEFLKKENLGKAVQSFDKMVGVTPFAISYISQHGLGGHSIPTDQALLNLMHVLGIISEDEAAKGKIPGLERAIPKAKGMEFSSLVHQLAVAFYKTPFSTSVRNQILKIDSSAKDRFPKRGGKKKEEAKPTKKAAAKDSSKAAAPAKKSAAKTTVKKAAKGKAAAAKKVPAKKKKTPVKKTKKPAAKKKATKKKPAKKKAAKKATKKKAPAKKAKKKKGR